MIVNAEEISLLRPREAKSSYIGTETVYEPCGTIRAEIQPIPTETALRLSGAGLEGGLTVVCEAGADIRERDRFVRGGITYGISSVLLWGGYTSAAAQIVRGA